MNATDTAVIAKQGDLEVVDAGNGFYLYQGDRCAALGDGVDWMHDLNGLPLWPGTRAFNKAVSDWLKADQDEIQEVYFPPLASSAPDAHLESDFEDRISGIQD